MLNRLNRAIDSAGLSMQRMRVYLHEMRLRLLHWLGVPGRDVADPSATLFQRIRGQMTLLYVAVLTATLLLAGTILYVAVNHRVMDPINSALDQSAQRASALWGNRLAQVGQTPCDVERPDQRYSLFACYNSQGTLTGASELALALPPYTDPSLAKQALISPTSCASDQITMSQGITRGSPEFGVVAREACVARAPSNIIIGVIQVGIPIGSTVNALRQLFILLLVIGACTIAVAALGGFLLSERAVAPARLAYARQQRFIGDVSHELRTPLTLLRADAEMLLRGRANLPSDDAELLEDMVDETARLASLTTSLLTLARLDSVNRLPERETVDLAEVATQVVRRTSAFAKERGVTVSAETTPGLFVTGALDLLEQAALILVDNAIKYSPSGVSVEVRAVRRGDRVALIVRDHGPGVAPEYLLHLGERFYRPDKARTRQTGRDGGAGLGISIARGVAALHQGTLTFASALGQGLTATLDLPAARLRAGASPIQRPNDDDLLEAHAQESQDTTVQ